MSVAYVHALAAQAGYSCQVPTVDDDSVDIQIAARGYVDDRPGLRSPRLDVQLKATSTLKPGSEWLSFPLNRKNYDDLRLKSLVPRLLMVLVLPTESGEWIETSEECMISRRCVYWVSLLGEPDLENTSSVTIRLPRSQRLDVERLRGLMERVSREEPL